MLHGGHLSVFLQLVKIPLFTITTSLLPEDEEP